MIDLTFFPRRFLNSAAPKSPVPGLLTVIFFKDNISFISIFRLDTTDAYAKFLVTCSSFNKFLSPNLCLDIILQPLINSFKPISSTEQDISGPDLLNVSVKCFSIMLAPKATAPKQE